MAMTAWAAKFLTSSICLSVKGRTSWRYMLNDTDQFVSLQHRHEQNRPDAAKFDGSDYPRMALLSVYFLSRSIGDVNHRLRSQHMTERAIRIGANWFTPACFGKGRRRVIRRQEVQSVAFHAEDISKLGVTDACGIFQHRVKYGLEIAR